MSSNVDLYFIVISGVNVSSCLLVIISNNIVNVNFEGYVCEWMVFINELLGGVGKVIIEWIIDKFV